MYDFARRSSDLYDVLNKNRPHPDDLKGFGPNDRSNGIKFIAAGFDAPHMLIKQTLEQDEYDEYFRRMESAVLRDPNYYMNIRYSSLLVEFYTRLSRVIVS